MLMRQILPVFQKQQRRGGEFRGCSAGLYGSRSLCVLLRVGEGDLKKTDEICQRAALVTTDSQLMCGAGTNLSGPQHVQITVQSGVCLPISLLSCHFQSSD